MPDSCTIGVEALTGPLDEATGKYTPAIAEPVYSGKCQLMGGGTARPIDAGGQLLIEQVSVLKLPVRGSEGVREGMIVRITDAAFDSEHVGVRLRITGPFHKSYAATRRFKVEEVR